MFHRKSFSASTSVPAPLAFMPSSGGKGYEAGVHGWDLGEFMMKAIRNECVNSHIEGF